MFKDQIGLCKVMEGEKEVVAYDTWDVGILHREFNGSFDINTIFLNSVLVRVSASLFL